MPKRLGVDLGEAVSRQIQHFEDVLHRVKVGDLDVGNVVGGQIEAHDIGGRWIGGGAIGS